MANSIQQLGLLQPIGVTPDNALVFGHRRVLAFKKLGRQTIPARVIDVPAIVLAEHAENEVRKEFTKSERVAIAQAIEAELGNRQGQRTDLKHEGQAELPVAELRVNLPEVPKGKTAEIAAGKAGFGNETTYRQGQRTDLKNDGQGELVADSPQVEPGKKSLQVAAKKAGFGNKETYRQAHSAGGTIPIAETWHTRRNYQTKAR